MAHNIFAVGVARASQLRGLGEMNECDWGKALSQGSCEAGKVLKGGSYEMLGWGVCATASTLNAACYADKNRNGSGLVSVTPPTSQPPTGQPVRQYCVQLGIPDAYAQQYNCIPGAAPAPAGGGEEWVNIALPIGLAAAVGIAIVALI